MLNKSIFDIHSIDRGGFNAISFKASTDEKKIWMATSDNCIGVMSLIMPDDHYILLANYKRWQIKSKGLFLKHIAISPYNQVGNTVALEYWRGQSDIRIRMPFKSNLRVERKGSIYKIVNQSYVPVGELVKHSKIVEVNILTNFDKPEYVLLAMFGLVYKLVKAS